MTWFIVFFWGRCRCSGREFRGSGPGSRGLHEHLGVFWSSRQAVSLRAFALCVRV